MKNEKKSILRWIEANRKLLIAAGISIPTIIAVVLGIKNRDALIQYFTELQELIKKGAEYSSKWFMSLSDNDLLAEREKVRQRHCSGDANAWNLLRLFDNEIRRRESARVSPSTWSPPVHREHGWYLFNDD